MALTHPRIAQEKWEDDKAYTLRKWINEQLWDASDLGPGNVLFSYIEGLLYCHITKPSLGVPLSKRWDGPFRSKYERSWLKDVYQDVEPTDLWDVLRKEIDPQGS